MREFVAINTSRIGGPWGGCAMGRAGLGAQVPHTELGQLILIP